MPRPGKDRVTERATLAQRRIALSPRGSRAEKQKVQWTFCRPERRRAARDQIALSPRGRGRRAARALARATGAPGEGRGADAPSNMQMADDPRRPGQDKIE